MMNEQLEICPFDHSHRVSRLQFQNHITKCRRNHPEIETKTCPFNASHILRIPDYQNHVIQCPDIVMMQRTMITDSKNGLISFPSTDAASFTNTQKNTSSIQPPSNENWEDEFIADSILESIKNKPPPRFIDSAKLSALKPSEKKEYYKSLNTPRSNSDSITPAKKEEETVKTVQPQLKKLRLPNIDSEMAALQALYKGRGMPVKFSKPLVKSGRIAANIFPSNETEHSGWNGGPMTAGIGRGRGRGTPRQETTVKPTSEVCINSKAKTKNSVIITHNITEVNGYKTMNGDESVFKDAEETSDFTADLQMICSKVSKDKEIKKLMKKLNQIQILEEKQRNSIQLNEDEVQKISQKENLSKLLDDLRLSEN